MKSKGNLDMGRIFMKNFFHVPDFTITLQFGGQYYQLYEILFYTCNLYIYIHGIIILSQDNQL